MSDKKIKITPEILLNAYCSGVFPMAESRNDRKDLMWFSPEARALIPIEKFHASASLRKKVKKFEYNVLFDKSFREVIVNCAEVRADTWINDEIIDLYCRLHELGFAHSVEVYNNGGALVGGLYGISIGGAFFGESMFSKENNTSKIALVYLAARLKHAGFELLDAQFDNPHLYQFGMYELPREKYIEILQKAIVKDVDFFDNQSSVENISFSSECSSSILEGSSLSEDLDSSGLCSSINSSFDSEVTSFLQSITHTS